MNSVQNELSDSIKDDSENPMLIKFVSQISTSTTARDKQDKGIVNEMTCALCSRRNKFIRGQCSLCKRLKITYSLNLKSAQKSEDEDNESFCMECLVKKVTKKQLNLFISSLGNHPEEGSAESIKDIDYFLDFCKLRQPDDSFAIVNLILREKIKTMLGLNSGMVSVLSGYQDRMNLREKMLSLKLISDNTESIVRLDSLIREESLDKKLNRMGESEQQLLLDEIKIYFSHLVSQDSYKDGPSAMVWNDPGNYPLQNSFKRRIGGSVLELLEIGGQGSFIGKREPRGDSCFFGSGYLNGLINSEYDQEDLSMSYSEGRNRPYLHHHPPV